MKKEIISNEILDKLPPHLLQYVKPQNYEDYTAINQAVWRYVIKKNVKYLSKVAHESYLEGLKLTGISVDSIPNMYGMNRILKEIGWAAICVDGLIPAAAFLEFQFYNVLVISSEIRQLSDIEYTPSPDIIHETAGHAPIIANAEYAEFLRRIGQIGSKAIASAKDDELHLSIKKLTDLTENGASKSEIEAAEIAVQNIQNSMTERSEMSCIRNLHWWSVEYGLIGEIDNPKMYGAGLLSSIGESKWCMSENVKKIPFSLETAYCDFDYTKPQPQLFVTPNFAHLSLIIEEFANSMALRKGGLSGVKKLIESQQIGTIELSTGLQISGIFTNVIEENGKAVYIQTTGKTALANRDKELIGHSVKTHPNGFGSPIGMLKNINLAIEDMSPRDLEIYNIYEGKTVHLEFEGNITITGEVITGKRNLKGKIMLISFKNCTVKHGKTVLFQPDWGIYDMAIGKKIVSAYAGAADNISFETPPMQILAVQPKNVPDKNQKDLEKLYTEVSNLKGDVDDELNNIFGKIKTDFPNEWLLLLEMRQLTRNNEIQNEISNQLIEVKNRNPKMAHLINDGLEF